MSQAQKTVLTQEDLVTTLEIVRILNDRYPEVLFDGILRDMDLSDEAFEALFRKLAEATDPPEKEAIA